MLKSVLSRSKPNFISLSEPQMFQCDAKQVMQHLEGEYCYHLNSDDLHDPELPLVKSRSLGGTMMLWNKEIDPYIEIINTTSTAFLPIVLKMPDLKVSIQVTIYLPTHGKDSEFVSDLADLRNCLDELIERYIDPIIFIRGDGNVNANNSMRVTLLQQFIADYFLVKTEVGHNTYHHFVGNGKFDSEIDLLLQSSNKNVSECVTKIMCKHENPGMLSHHDIIMSSFTIPIKDESPLPANLISAPKCDHSRVKIIWSLEGQNEYSELVGTHLRQAREQWLDASSQISMSVLLSTTNNILSKCATMTNKFVSLGAKTVIRSKPTPKLIRIAANKMSKAHKKYKSTAASHKYKVSEVAHAKLIFSKAIKKYRQAVRQNRLQESLERYQQLDQILDNPASAFRYIKSCRKTKPTQIEQLTVGDKVYAGPTVCDGFYDSMSSLKHCDLEQLRTDPHLTKQFSNYEHIMKICQDQHSIPSLSLAKSRLEEKCQRFLQYNCPTLHQCRP